MSIVYKACLDIDPNFNLISLINWIYMRGAYNGLPRHPFHKFLLSKNEINDIFFEYNKKYNDNLKPPIFIRYAPEGYYPYKVGAKVLEDDMIECYKYYNNLLSGFICHQANERLSVLNSNIDRIKIQPVSMPTIVDEFRFNCKIPDFILSNDLKILNTTTGDSCPCCYKQHLKIKNMDYTVKNLAKINSVFYNKALLPPPLSPPKPIETSTYTEKQESKESKEPEKDPEKIKQLEIQHLKKHLYECPYRNSCPDFNITDLSKSTCRHMKPFDPKSTVDSLKILNPYLHTQQYPMQPQTSSSMFNFMPTQNPIQNQQLQGMNYENIKNKLSPEMGLMIKNLGILKTKFDEFNEDPSEQALLNLNELYNKFTLSGMGEYGQTRTSKSKLGNEKLDEDLKRTRRDLDDLTDLGDDVVDVDSEKKNENKSLDKLKDGKKDNEFNDFNVALQFTPDEKNTINLNPSPEFLTPPPHDKEFIKDMETDPNMNDPIPGNKRLYASQIEGNLLFSPLKYQDNYDRDRQDRQDNRQDRQDNRQDNRQDRQDNRQDRDFRQNRDFKQNRDFRQGRDDRQGRDFRQGRDDRQGRDFRQGRDDRQGRDFRQGRDRGPADQEPENIKISESESRDD